LFCDIEGSTLGATPAVDLAPEQAIGVAQSIGANDRQ
jgi:hypothetical protein